MILKLGLTGSIGMGKSATAELFRKAGVPVHDADRTVHDLYSGEAIPLIEAAFPGTTGNGSVDREKLSQCVLGNADAIKRLESIVHPLVGCREKQFIERCANRGLPLVVLDVPLLLETGGQARCDAVVVVSAPPDVQRQRVLARTGMTEQRFQTILARQMPDWEKRRRAHFLVDSGRGFDAAARAVRDILRALAGRPGRAPGKPSRLG
jgi:dephospho-CoA kinase